MNKLLILGKKTGWCDRAIRFAKNNFKGKVTAIQGDVGDPFPKKLYTWKGDIIVSFLSPWIIPEKVLRNASKVAINFHPAPPEYPGIGCYNFAIYDGAKRYGVTCHHMLQKVDSGEVIAADFFPVGKNETVLSLKEKSMRCLFGLFVKVMRRINDGEPLPKSKLRWMREPFTRRQLNELCEISTDMSMEEAVRRVRATYYPGMPGAYIKIAGLRFNFSGEAL